MSDISRLIAQADQLAKDRVVRNARIAALEEALADLIDAAENRVPGDEALWENAIEEAREVLSQAENSQAGTEQ